MDIQFKKLYKQISLGLSIIFAVVGLIFLFVPDKVILFFNMISGKIGFPETSLPEFGLYQILAVGYMYLVTLLAYFMYKDPNSKYFPLLLIHGKSASSIISLVFFFIYQSSLILLTNFIVDGFIAIGIFFLYQKIRGIQE